MKCCICRKVLPGRRRVCPVICRSRHRENLRIERDVARHYARLQANRRRAA